MNKYSAKENIWTANTNRERCSTSLVIQFISVQSLSRVWFFATLWTVAWQASLSSLSPKVCSSSGPLSWWCYPSISPSVTLISSCLKTFSASASFPLNQLFTWGGQSIKASVLASVLPMTIQDWFPLRLTGFISLLSKGLWRVFSSTTIQKHQFFGDQPSL